MAVKVIKARTTTTPTTSTEDDVANHETFHNHANLSTHQQQVNHNNKARLLLVGTGTMGKIRAKVMAMNPRIELCGIIDSVDYQGAQRLASMYSTKAFHTLEEAMDTLQRVISYLKRQQIGRAHV